MVQDARAVMAERYLRARVMPEHPLRVAALVAGTGAEPWLVATALLHDVVRDTNTRAYELERRVDPRVLRAVEVLDEVTGPGAYQARARRKRERVAAAEWGVALVFAADLVDRLRVLHRAPTELSAQRRAHYRAAVRLVLSREPTLPWNAETAELGGSVLGDG